MKSRNLLSLVLSFLVFLSVSILVSGCVSHKAIVIDGVEYTRKSNEPRWDASPSRDAGEVLEIKNDINGEPVTEFFFKIESAHNVKRLKISRNVTEINLGIKGDGIVHDFGICDALEAIYIERDNPNYYDIDGVLFSKRGELLAYPREKKDKHYDIPAGTIKIGDWAFRNCKHLASISIPDDVEKIGSVAFRGCTSLAMITIPASAKMIDYDAWGVCTSLEAIHVDKDNPNYYDIDGVLFSKQGELLAYPRGKKGKHYTIPAGTSKIGDSAFMNSKHLVFVSIPDGVIVIGERSFEGTSLESITIPKSTTIIEYGAFGSTESLTAIHLDKDNPNYYDIDGVLFNKQGELLAYPRGKKNKHYDIPAGTIKIGDNAFRDSEYLASISIPDGMQTIGSHAFDGTSLESTIIPKSVTTIEYGAFWRTASLTAIRVGKGNPNYYDIDGVLFNKQGELLAYPRGKKNKHYDIPAGTIKIGDSAFRECKHLSSVSIPNGVRAIDDYAFSLCASLKSITIPASVSTIDESAFDGTILRYVIIPDDYKIKNDAFGKEAKIIRKGK